MSRSAGKTLLDILKMLFVAAFKLTALCFAWICKIAGTVLLKIGETVEKTLVK